LLGSAAHTKGLGSALVSATKRLIAACRSTTDRKTPRFSRCFDSLAKYLHRIQPRTRCRGEVEREPLVPVEPGANLGMLVSRVVIENDMNGLAGWHLCLDGVQEADELLMAMALHVATDDGAVEHIERSEQCRRAMTLVRGLSFRRAPSSWEGPAGFDRTPGFGSSRQPTGRWREPAGRHRDRPHRAACRRTWDR